MCVFLGEIVACIPFSDISPQSKTGYILCRGQFKMKMQGLFFTKHKANLIKALKHKACSLFHIYSLPTDMLHCAIELHLRSIRSKITGLSMWSCVPTQVDYLPVQLALSQTAEVQKASHFYRVETELISH